MLRHIFLDRFILLLAQPLYPNIIIRVSQFVGEHHSSLTETPL